MPTASRVEPPGRPGHEAARHRAGRRAAPAHLEAEREHDHGDEGGDRRLQPAEPPHLHAEDRERGDAGQYPRHPQREAEHELQAERGADELGQVGRHRDRLGLQPQEHHDPEREPVPAHLGQAAAGGDAELGAERLDQHRHQVGDRHHPEQGVAVLGAARHVGGEVARVHVGDRGDEGRAEERQHREDAAAARPTASPRPRPASGRPPRTPRRPRSVRAAGGRRALPTDGCASRRRGRGLGTAAWTSRARAGAAPRRATRTPSSARPTRPTASAPRPPACWW